ncbi:diguanylate cyclase [Nodosilinea sp. P-1105]|uniref:diguanylate cyclase domain-containing protein n=1 Tax=Nodosilinea sp. P-1105 TaxID=2546229 RepID=UPI00146D4F1E|nr:diguanylate cyclase [Nodosilinea sp. P-1105]NMF83783.1 diguanylate cyclase [Nodosilinea sp. P-1105]
MSTFSDPKLSAADTVLPWEPNQPLGRLLTTSCDAMVVLDNQSCCLEANEVACQLLELPRQTLVGRPMTEFVDTERNFEGLWQAWLQQGQGYSECHLRLASGAVKPGELSLTAHISPHCHLAIFRDTSDRQQLEAERSALKRQLEQQTAQQAAQLLQVEADLRSQQQRMDSILNSLESVVWSVHPNSLATIYVNSATQAVYGYSPEAFLSHPELWFNCVYPEDRSWLMAAIQQLDQTGKLDCEYRIVRADGIIRWVHGQARLVVDAEQNPIRIDGTTVDISDRKQAELALKDLQATQQAMLDAIPDLLMRVNGEGYILNLISGGEIALYGPISRDHPQSVYVGFPKALADLRMHYVHQALITRTQQRYEHALELNDQTRYEESRVVPLNDHEVLIMVRDITQRKQAEAAQVELNQQLTLVNTQLNRLATIDGLTQLANRRSFDQALDREWLRARRQQTSLALILCDIDYFKPYNDNYGHLAGDNCLQQVAQMLQSVSRRPGDLVARYGGEEFVMLLPNTSIDGAVQLTEDIQRAIAALNLAHAYSLVSGEITLSFGLVSHYPTPQEHSPRELLHRADMALYQAKAAGRNCYTISQP